MRWTFRFTEYEYTFKYKPGKLNCNADALSRNPVDDPSPCLKIMMMKNGNNNTQRPESTEAKPRGRLPSAAEAPGPSTTRGGGQPMGSKTRKTAPRLDHSLIAHRKRMRAAANKQRLLTTSSPAITGSTKKPGDKPTTPGRAVTSSPMASTPLDADAISPSEAEKIFTTPKPKYIDVNQGPRFSQSPILLLYSKAVESENEHDIDKFPILGPRQSCLREEDSDEASGSRSEDSRSAMKHRPM